jgi:hypothetical protein
MRRFQPTKLLRFLLAAVVALASFGPQGTYAHSHSVANDVHHEHADHDAPAHDDHDDEHGPGLSDGVAHVHGSWLGFAITLPATDGAVESLSLSACPSLSVDLGKGLFGPLKERVPWPEFFVPPEPLPLSALAGHPSRNPLVDGARTSYALAGRTLVLRC